VENKQVKEINIGSNSMNENGSKAISEALKLNTIIKKFKLCCNWLNIEQQLAHSIYEALKSNTVLQTLDLGFNHI